MIVFPGERNLRPDTACPWSPRENREWQSDTDAVADTFAPGG